MWTFHLLYYLIFVIQISVTRVQFLISWRPQSSICQPHWEGSCKNNQRLNSDPSRRLWTGMCTAQHQWWVDQCMYLPVLQLIRFWFFYLIAVKYMNITTDKALVRSPRDHYRLVWSAISVITSIQDSPCSVNVIHIGGNLCYWEFTLKYFYSCL